MREDIAATLGAHPSLGYAGFACGHTDGRPRPGCRRIECGTPERDDLARLRTDDSAAVIHAAAVILERARHTKAVYAGSPGSYTLKHLVEDQLKTHPIAHGYVSNGQLIAAALLCGFPVLPDGDGSPNAGIGLHRADLGELKRATGRSEDA